MTMRFVLLLYAISGSALQILPPPADVINHDPSISFRYADTAKTVYVTTELASRRDSGGLTLIPPSGLMFAETFRDELATITKEEWTLSVVESLDGISSGIKLDLSNARQASFTYANGAPTEEGYHLDIGASYITILGSGARGTFWGTRTVLQALILSNWTEIAGGTVTEAPEYATRGYMLDAGRKWYSSSFLKELCTYASFFKMSEFHYHTSDNYPLNRGHNETWQNVYAQFSLHPESEDLAGLVQRPNETLSRADFEDLQQHCAQRGITIIPEIEAPGHCLTITKWKPELALTKKDLLNLTHPESIPTVKKIWSEFLPWFQTKEVHIGADEYDAKLADNYITFVNEMASFINATSGKRTRIWGTEEPSENLTISKDVIIQHWQYGQSDPIELQKSGCDLINSQDYWAYMSLKNDHAPILPAPYPPFFNTTRIVPHASDSKAWQWGPNSFNTSAANTTAELQPGSRGLRGAIKAAWNDNGPDATTQLEAYYALRAGIALVAARSWGGAALGSDILASVEFWAANAPSQNLERRTGFVSWTRNADTSPDPVQLGGGSKGMNYTLELSVTGPFVLASDDVSLSLEDDGKLVFTSDGYDYPLRSVTEGDGFEAGFPGRIWVNASTSSHKPVSISTPAEITITGDVIGGSRVWVNGSFAGRFEVYVFGGRNTQFSWSQMAFVAPLETVSGGIRQINLTDGIKAPSSVGGGGGAAGPSPGPTVPSQSSCVGLAAWRHVWDLSCAALVLLAVFVAAG